MRLLLMSVIIVIVTVLPPGDCDEHHRTARIDDYGDSVTMTCQVDSGYTFDYWLLPDLVTKVRNSYTGDMVVYNPSNHSLYIDRVEKEHLGDYICRTISTSVTGASLYYKTTLYLYIPSTWEQYRHNVIVGSIAAACCLVFFTVVCAIDTCRYNRQERKREERAAQMEMESSGSHGNQHFSNVAGNYGNSGMMNEAYRPEKYLAADGSLVINTSHTAL